LPIIIQKLKDKYKPNLDKIKDKGDFSLIKDLIEEINSLSKEKKLEILRIYTQNILSAIDSFDIDKVSLLINEYDNMVKRLEKLYEENKDV
jgi:F0F1-type ATP synthase gamma subunit